MHFNPFSLVVFMNGLDELGDVKGKTLLVRVDLNSSIEGGKVVGGPRFEVHAETVRELSSKGAKVVLLAHQGRPGKKDFASLKGHAKVFGKSAKRKVKFFDELFSERVLSKIAKMTNGKIFLLENTRFYAEEDLGSPETLMVKQLSGVADAFVLDAFSVAHRPHTSVVGFSGVLPCFAGRALAKEFEALSKLKMPERPVTYCLGGAKMEEVLSLLETSLPGGTVDRVLCSGVAGELFLLAKGVDLGAKKGFLEEKGFTQHLPRFKKLLEEYGEKIVLPEDFAFEDKDGFRVELDLEQVPKVGKPVFDVGSRTIKGFKKIIRDSATVFVKGPAGMYEKPCFEAGTQQLFKAVASCKGFTVVGGGDTGTALKKLGVRASRFGYVSTSGGAMLEFLAGRKLPGLEALNE